MRPSPSSTMSDSRTTSSTSISSSFPGHTKMRTPEPRSFSPAMFIHRRTPSSMICWKVSFRLSAFSSSSSTLAGDGHRVVAVLLDDRDHRLARHVAAADEDLGLIELGRVQELAPAHLGAVQVGGEKNPGHWPTSPPALCESLVRTR